jgi:adenylate cyclase class 2
LIEHEVKLAFESVEAARRAVTTAGGRLVVSRRLIDDQLFDTADRRLKQAGVTLRVRRADDVSYLTFKGPVQAGPVKSREEIETTVGDPGIVEAIVLALGFRPFFRAQKYREEYALDIAHLTVDEAPIGVFVEIEAPPKEIERVAGQLGRTPEDFHLDSYQRLYLLWCEREGVAPTNMVFP